MHALAVPAKKPARRSPRQPETASIRRVLARSHGRVGRCRVSRRAGADRLAQRRRRRVPGRVHAPAGTRHRVRKRRAPESLAAARHGEPLPRLGAFDLEPPHGRLHAGACRHPRPRRVRRRHLGGRGRVAARPAHPGAPVLRRGLRHRRDRAHHGMPTQHRANPPPPRPRAVAEHAGRRPRPTRVEPCKLPRPPMPKGAEP